MSATTRAKRSPSVKEKKCLLLGANTCSQSPSLSKRDDDQRGGAKSKETVVLARRRPLTSHLVEQPLFGFKTNRTTHRVDERARQFASSIVPIVRHAREIRRPLPGRDGRVARAVASSLCSFVVVSTTVPTRFFASLDRSRLHLCVQSNDVSLSLSLGINNFFEIFFM